MRCVLKKKRLEGEPNNYVDDKSTVAHVMSSPRGKRSLELMTKMYTIFGEIIYDILVSYIECIFIVYR